MRRNPTKSHLVTGTKWYCAHHREFSTSETFSTSSHFIGLSTETRELHHKMLIPWLNLRQLSHCLWTRILYQWQKHHQRLYLLKYLQLSSLWGDPAGLLAIQNCWTIMFYIEPNLWTVTFTVVLLVTFLLGFQNVPCSWFYRPSLLVFTISNS